jgi:AraC family transcriptional regulator of adaptative response/methylated-DNA-[protein]-cysteine methyltransferase
VGASARHYVSGMKSIRIDAMPLATRRKEKSLNDRRWAAVLARDKTCDGTFVLAVETTGIYCRPSCPARKPLRRNVRFFATGAEAAAAGFRPCKRCTPDAVSRPDPSLAKVIEACRMIEQAETPPTLEALASGAGMSRYHFHRVFKAATGVTPKAYAEAHRQRRLRAALKGDNTVTEAIYASGFNSSGRFYAQAGEALGMTPGDFRAGGAGNEIEYAAAPCSLGIVMVAASTRGVCSIMLGNDERQLMDDLRKRFAKARLVPGDDDFAKLLGKVVALIETPQKRVELPLDVRGTAFQHQVWMALRDIPAGKTASYSEIARRIGKPDAVRAVGAACGANPLAVVIPCHRVVGKDGKLTGYRWGTARKRALLDREKA